MASRNQVGDAVIATHRHYRADHRADQGAHDTIDPGAHGGTHIGLHNDQRSDGGPIALRHVQRLSHGIGQQGCDQQTRYQPGLGSGSIGLAAQAVDHGHAWEGPMRIQRGGGWGYFRRFVGPAAGCRSDSMQIDRENYKNILLFNSALYILSA